MSDLLKAFLDGDIDNRNFRHGDHVRVGFEILEGRDFPQASTLFSRSLKRIAAKAGHPEAYHETITFAFLALIAERMKMFGEGSFEEFVKRNTDLMEKSVLIRWYDPERLSSQLARSTFILPAPTR